MSRKLKVSLFISIIRVFSICVNSHQTASAEDVKSKVVNLKVFSPKNNTFLFKVDLPLFANQSNPFKFDQQVNQDGEEEKMNPETNDMNKKIHFIFPGISGPGSDASKDSDVENTDKEKAEPTPQEDNEEENKRPWLKFFIFRRVIPPPESSGNDSLFTEDCDQLNNQEPTEGVQDVKSNSENVSDSEVKNEINVSNLTNNTVKPSSEGVPLQSADSKALELERNLQEIEKIAVISSTSKTETSQGDVVIIIVTVIVSLILLLIMLVTIINFLRVRKHRDLLDIEKFRRENEKENAAMENNEQDFYNWIKTRMIPSHFKAQCKGQESKFPENADPHQLEKKNSNIYSINTDITR